MSWNLDSSSGIATNLQHLQDNLLLLQKLVEPLDSTTAIKKKGSTLLSDEKETNEENEQIGQENNLLKPIKKEEETNDYNEEKMWNEEQEDYKQNFEKMVKLKRMEYLKNKKNLQQKRKLIEMKKQQVCGNIKQLWNIGQQYHEKLDNKIMKMNQWQQMINNEIVINTQKMDMLQQLLSKHYDLFSNSFHLCSQSTQNQSHFLELVDHCIQELQNNFVHDFKRTKTKSINFPKNQSEFGNE
ncbi:hypothetical protein RFI_03534 [Reticulomyxa filosa]|uniref:Uncharacterized protein n=1 Tax=Reticulomyxa filosa TaxID=46433 RepID=X6P7F8_RETFI|nr:hypothetical protein RFI_03534 [Reticulomyxa filosa]|eukprot:ETO33572.1 hypothetical protein RFI_03534 [Reticulomyxa filosa]